MLAKPLSLHRITTGALRARSTGQMAWTFPYSHVRITVSAVALLLAPFIGTADAQVSVPGNYATIQSAINAVLSGALPDGTRIDVQPGTYFEVLSVANTSRSMTVRGVGGPGATIVDAGGRMFPVLNVLRATGQVVFTGLTFRNAATSVEGGGFLIREASPSLVDAIFESNSALPWWWRGAVCLQRDVYALHHPQQLRQPLRRCVDAGTWERPPGRFENRISPTCPPALSGGRCSGPVRGWTCSTSRSSSRSPAADRPCRRPCSADKKRGSGPWDAASNVEVRCRRSRHRVSQSQFGESSSSSSWRSRRRSPRGR